MVQQSANHSLVWDFGILVLFQGIIYFSSKQMPYSPSKYRSNNSPIRHLDKRLDTIVEERLFPDLKRSRKLLHPTENLVHENSLLASKIQHYNSENAHMVMENSNLKNQNELLSIKNLEIINDINENQKECELKNAEISSLHRTIESLEMQNLTLTKQNENLKRNVYLLEDQKAQESLMHKQRLAKFVEENANINKKTYLDDINKLAMDLDMNRQLLFSKEKEINHLSVMAKTNSDEYHLNVESLISENNILRNQLAQIEASKEREIKGIQYKKELEKSRTQGIMSYCKENNSFIEKELSRIVEQLLEKNLSIEGFTKELLKQKKLQEISQKRHEEIVDKLEAQHDDIINEKEEQIRKMEKNFHEEFSEQKKVELNLIETIARKEHDIDTLNRVIKEGKDEVIMKEQSIRELRDNIEKIQDDHAREISKVMNESVRRRSSKNLSSYISSLKDIEENQGSSIIKTGNLQRQNSFSNESKLPTVRQELAHSQNHQDQIDVKELILHYENMLDELKKNKKFDLDMANDKISELKQKLNQKQQEVLDVLNRFSPLLEYKVNPADIDEERRTKIQQNYKADISILTVMLEKYRIVGLKHR